MVTAVLMTRDALAIMLHMLVELQNEIWPSGSRPGSIDHLNTEQTKCHKVWPTSVVLAALPIAAAHTGWILDQGSHCIM